MIHNSRQNKTLCYNRSERIKQNVNLSAFLPSYRTFITLKKLFWCKRKSDYPTPIVRPSTLFVYFQAPEACLKLSYLPRIAFASGALHIDNTPEVSLFLFAFFYKTQPPTCGGLLSLLAYSAHFSSII